MDNSLEERAEAIADELPRFRLIHAGELESRPVDWLVRDLLERNSLAAWFGTAGSAKTFIVLDLACCIATGTDYHGRPVKSGTVIYLAGEGFNGITRRLTGWGIWHGIAVKDIALHVSTMPARLTDMQSLAEVIEAIEATGAIPELIVLDTVARNFGPGDENSTSDMSEFVWACDELRHRFDSTVLLVHHSGHGDSSRGRGSSVLDGALDTAYRVSRSGDLIAIENKKMKDGPEPEPYAFMFRPVELGFNNDDGTPATSAVLQPAEVIKEPAQATGKHQKHALDCLERLFQKHRENLVKSGLPPETAKVTVADWKNTCIDENMPRPRWYDAKTSLADIGLIEVIGNHVSLKGPANND